MRASRRHRHTLPGRCRDLAIVAALAAVCIAMRLAAIPALSTPRHDDAISYVAATGHLGDYDRILEPQPRLSAHGRRPATGSGCGRSTIASASGASPATSAATTSIRLSTSGSSTCGCSCRRERPRGRHPQPADRGAHSPARLPSRASGQSQPRGGRRGPCSGGEPRGSRHSRSSPGSTSCSRSSRWHASGRCCEPPIPNATPTAPSTRCCSALTVAAGLLTHYHFALVVVAATPGGAVARCVTLRRGAASLW